MAMRTKKHVEKPIMQHQGPRQYTLVQTLGHCVVGFTGKGRSTVPMSFVHHIIDEDYAVLFDGRRSAIGDAVFIKATKRHYDACVQLNSEEANQCDTVNFLHHNTMEIL